MFERINYYHHFPLECLESNHGSFVLEKVKDFNFITFVNENFFGIIFLIWAFVAIIRIIHNCILMIKYRAGDNKYEIKRDKNEGEDKERHSIYLVCKEKNSDGKFIYHHVDTDTYQKLGYPRPSRVNDSDCFDTKDENYVMGKNIIIYNIIEILKLTNVTL